MTDVANDDEHHASERAELHFLAAMVDELMKAMKAGGLLTRDQLQAVEDAVAERVGAEPRAW